MDNCSIISKIKFVPFEGINGHCGYVRFLFDGKFAFKGLRVYHKLDRSGYRVIYPEAEVDDNETKKDIDAAIPIRFKGKSSIYPISTETQKMIDEEVTKHIKTKGASNDQTTTEINYNR